MKRSGIREDMWMMKSLFPDSAAIHPGYRGWFPGGQGLEAGFYRRLVKTLDADKNLLAGSIMTLPAFNFYPLVFFEVLVVLVEVRDLLQLFMPLYVFRL